MSVVDELKTFAQGILDSANSCLPARVVKVNSDGSVNVVAIRNDGLENCVVTVPVLRPETQRAYIQLKIKAGDRGVIKFCDKSVENYRLTGSEEYNKDDRQHSLSDGVFQLGFLPDNEKFVFPDGEIVIGLKSGTFVMSVNESGNLTITAQNITLNASQTTITSPIKVTGDIELEGKLDITGDVSVTGEITATKKINSDVDVYANNAISLKTHVHGSVMSGNSTTGVPQ